MALFILLAISVTFNDVNCEALHHRFTNLSTLPYCKEICRRLSASACTRIDAAAINGRSARDRPAPAWPQGRLPCSGHDGPSAPWAKRWVTGGSGLPRRCKWGRTGKTGKIRQGFSPRAVAGTVAGHRLAGCLRRTVPEQHVPSHRHARVRSPPLPHLGRRATAAARASGPGYRRLDPSAVRSS